MMERPFYAQLHLHTSESSRCGRSTAAEMMRACKDAGYSLVVVTDHFFNANINCDFSLPWPRQVDCLMKGYWAARAEGERLGLTVLFGWETNNGGPEVLTYGLGRDYLLAHPDIAQWPLEEYLARVKAAGGFCCHAHPFREAYYIVPFQPQPQLFEAFEVFNNHHAPENRIWDEKALAMAQEYHLIQLAGCDAHRAQEVTGGAVKLPWPVSDMPGLIAALRSRKTEVIPHL